MKLSNKQKEALALLKKRLAEFPQAPWTAARTSDLPFTTVHALRRLGLVEIRTELVQASVTGRGHMYIGRSAPWFCEMECKLTEKGIATL